MITDPIFLAELAITVVFGTLIVWRCRPSYRRRQLRKEARAHVEARRALHIQDPADHGDRQA